MRCSAPLTLSVTKNGLLPKVPCGQCLACRIDRRDKWVTRCLLEFLASGIGQFWTLTFSDEGLSTLQERGARKLYNNWLSALRTKEIRTLGRSSIRSFGVCEHGETLGRPHIHVLLFNHYSSILPQSVYKPGLPRPRFNIAQWPHGHVDCCPMTVSSARYVCKYVTKFDQALSGLKPLVFHPRRPCLGYAGLELHVRNLSRSPIRAWQHSTSIELGGRKWALDQTMRQHFSSLCRQYGLRFDSDTLEKRRQAQIDRVAKEDQEPWNIQDGRLRREAVKQRLHDDYAKGRELRRLQVLSRAASLADAR